MSVSEVDVGRSKANDILSLLYEHMPQDSKSPHISLLPGFTSLRLLLLKSSPPTSRDIEVINELSNQFTTYSVQNKSRQEIALQLARHYMVMTKQHVSVIQPQHNVIGQHRQQQHEMVAHNPSPSEMLVSGGLDHRLQLTPAQLSLMAGGGLTPVFTSSPSPHHGMMQPPPMHLDPLGQLQHHQSMQGGFQPGGSLQLATQNQQLHSSQQMQPGKSSLQL